MKKYELMYILRADLDEAARKAEIDKLHGLLEKGGCKINNVNEWGVRDLAYQIKKQAKGYYVVVKFECETAQASKEFERLSRIDSNVLRYLITIDQE